MNTHRRKPCLLPTALHVSDLLVFNYIYLQIHIQRIKYYTLSIHIGPGWISRHSDSLRAGRAGDRIPVCARFSANIQTDPGAQPASYTMSTVSFPGVKRPERGVDHPPPSRAEVKERVELYLYSPHGLS